MYQIPDIVVRKKKKKVPLPGLEPRLSGLPAKAHYLQTTWKVLTGENGIIQVSHSNVWDNKICHNSKLKAKNHLNSIHPSIKFTMELEEGGSIPFLDTRVTRKVEGKLDITVYRKPTHTDWYLHFSSHHPTHVKKGLVRCPYDRARSITKETTNLKTEKAHLAGALNATVTKQPSSKQHR